MDLKEKQIELVNFPNKNELNEKINNLSKEIGNIYKAIEEKQVIQYKFIKKRNEIQKIIIQQKFEHSKNILNDYFQYFIIILQNMKLEAKKFTDLAELKIKDLQLDALTNQIKVKDSLIDNANNELKKKFKADLLLKNDKSLIVKENKISNYILNQDQDISKSQNLMKNLMVKDIKLNKIDKNNIQNFKNLLGNFIENKQGPVKVIKPNFFSVPKNIGIKNLNVIDNENKVINRSKSPKIVKEKINEILNKKSITDKSHKNSSLISKNLSVKKQSTGKNLQQSNKKKLNIFNINQNVNTESIEDLKK